MQQGPRPVSDQGAHRHLSRYPALILGALALRHYGYSAFPHQYAALVWNITGAALFLAALVYVALRVRRGWVLYPLGWWMAEEAMVIGCNAAYIGKPWTVKPGEDMCSSLLALDLGLVGALVLAGFAMRQAMRD